MTHSPITPGQPGQPGRLDALTSSQEGGSKSKRVTDPSGPSFEALLERLQSKAQELQEASRQLENPADLAHAVEDARASLEDAGSLGERLLEAFHEARTLAQQQERALDAREGDA